MPRRLAYEAAHPDVTITYQGPYWRAVVPEDNGETVVVRHDLKALLDKLESLDTRPGDEPGEQERTQ